MLLCFRVWGRAKMIKMVKISIVLASFFGFNIAQVSLALWAGVLVALCVLGE